VVQGDIPIVGKEFGDWVMAEDLWVANRGFAEYILVDGEIVEIRLKVSSASGGWLGDGGERKFRIKYFV